MGAHEALAVPLLVERRYIRALRAMRLNRSEIASARRPHLDALEAAAAAYGAHVGRGSGGAPADKTTPKARRGRLLPDCARSVRAT